MKDTGGGFYYSKKNTFKGLRAFATRTIEQHTMYDKCRDCKGYIQPCLFCSSEVHDCYISK